MFKQKNNFWFTLVEIIIWILISSTIIIAWFQFFASVSIWKVKLIESTNIEKETFFFTQKLFEEIKKWWLIDYEEYFNRQVVNTWNAWDLYLSWHFKHDTWFGNFWQLWNVWTTTYWNWFYYCRSWDWVQMWTLWCVFSWAINDVWTSFAWIPQRYGEYSFQFIDYNSNYDDDWGDEDWNWSWSIIWDEDDEYLWEWPSVFESWTWVTELYLLSADKKKRTIFRWNVKQDPEVDWVYNCDFTTNPSSPTWTWCLWTIEFLKLDWKDWWLDHSTWSNDFGEYDWVIDTWLIDSDFAWWTDVAWSNNTNYWLPLFPDTINVSSFEVFAYPNKDIDLAWKDASPETNISPYVRLKLKLSPSWKVKKKISWKVPEFEINTTISLTDIYSR